MRDSQPPPAAKRASARSAAALPVPFHAAFRADDFRKCVPALPRPADHRQADPAVVRRIGRRMDDVPRVLPVGAARRLRVRGPRRAPAVVAPSGAVCTPRCSWRASLALPIVPGAFWKPAGSENPAALILGLLAVTLGLPYFLLSTTSPLLQAWFARRYPGRNPYRLFALSNLASLLALLALSVRDRAVDSDADAGARMVRRLCAVRRAVRRGGVAQFADHREARDCAARPSRRGASAGADARPAAPVVRARGDEQRAAAVGHEPHHAEHRGGAAAVDRAADDLPADVHPLLRKQPPGIRAKRCCRSRPRRSASWRGASPIRGLTHELELQLGVFCVGLFIVCMFCHGELARLKPAPALPDALLPDGFARRRGRRRARRHRRAARPARVLRAAAGADRRRVPPRLAGARRRARLRVARDRRRHRDDRMRDLARHRLLRHDDRHRAQFLRRAARAGERRRRREPAPHARFTARSCTASNTWRRNSGARRRATTRRRPASAACSRRCIRAWSRCASA